MKLSERAVLGRRRGVMLIILPLVLIALAVVVRLLADEGPGPVKIVVGEFGLGLVLPLVALIASSIPARRASLSAAVTGKNPHHSKHIVKLHSLLDTDKG